MMPLMRLMKDSVELVTRYNYNWVDIARRCSDSGEQWWLRHWRLRHLNIL